MHIVLYNTYNLNKSLNDLEENIIDVELRYKATDLVTSGYLRFEEMQNAVKRAMSICKAADIRVRKHFKAVYLCREGILLRDWRLSHMARKLVLLNGDANNPYVAKIQLELLE